MDAEKLVAAIERFFLDIIGTIIPGAILLTGLWAIFGDTKLGNLTLKPPAADPGWVFFILAAYVVGHALTSIGESVITPLSATFAAGLRRVGGINKLVPPRVRSQAEMNEGIAQRPTFRQFVSLMGLNPAATGAQEVTGLRNVAMTIADDTRPTVHRFMFLSLLNLGVATALQAMAVAVLIRFVVTAVGQHAWTGVGTAIGIAAALSLAACPFIERRFWFVTSAMHLPFDAAVAKLQQDAAPSAPTGSQAQDSEHPRIYLAGGLVSNWQDTVIQAVPAARFLDPRTHGLRSPAAFTSWDLAAIRRCDILFAYLEANNPGGYALSLEMGFAKALGKHIVLVDEKSAADPGVARVLTMVHATADVEFEDFGAAVHYLRARLTVQ